MQMASGEQCSPGGLDTTTLVTSMTG